MVLFMTSQFVMSAGLSLSFSVCLVSYHLPRGCAVHGVSVEQVSV